MCGECGEECGECCGVREASEVTFAHADVVTRGWDPSRVRIPPDPLVAADAGVPEGSPSEEKTAARHCERDYGRPDRNQGSRLHWDDEEEGGGS